MDATRRLQILTLVLVAASVVSGIRPKEYPTWVMEVAPVWIALVVLWCTRRRFPITPLMAVLIGFHGLILCLGGHYTYAEVPLGRWAQDWFGFARNHYDRLGHLAQGFVPAIVAREVILRNTTLRPGGWLFFLVVCVCLAVSAFYELIEWWTALAFGGGAVAFLGTQGDVWDAQADMLMALIGAILALVTLARLHDKQLKSVSTSAPQP